MASDADGREKGRSTGTIAVAVTVAPPPALLAPGLDILVVIVMLMFISEERLWMTYVRLVLVRRRIFRW